MHSKPYAMHAATRAMRFSEPRSERDSAEIGNGLPSPAGSETVLLELGPERALADPETRGGRCLVVVGLHERAQNELALDLAERSFEVEIDGRLRGGVVREQRAQERR